VANETILVEREGGVVTVTLNRPEKKNAGNGPTWRELRAVLLEVAYERGDRVLVVTGAGGDFCSGADITDPNGLSGDPNDTGIVRMRFMHEAMLALHELPKPTIAKIRGVATGAGLSLAVGCDLTVASDGARFSGIFARRALSVDGGASWLLPRLVGLHKAKELVYFADMYSAEEAASMGLVNHVVPDAQLDAFVDDWARRLAQGPTIALSMTKKLLNSSANVTMAQALEDEARCQVVNSFTDDTVEAMRAFGEKREPRFMGH
jgi:2-(1,2-epoxy-1,2-dihydrophenyl)acetyl-CoA isomerase